jgi:hypothetical protein
MTLNLSSNDFLTAIINTLTAMIIHALRVIKIYSCWRICSIQTIIGDGVVGVGVVGVVRWISDKN